MATGAAKVFYVDHVPVRSIEEIRAGGVPVAYADYAYDLDEGWIALASAPPAGTGSLEIDYTYARQLDLVVTNWDPDDPNVAFLHEIATTVAAGAPPAGVLLLPNRPNPFNPSTVIPIRLGEAGRVEVGVYDLSGRLVRTIFRGAVGAGTLDLSWDGTDEALRPVASGVYFTRVEAEDRVETRRMTLIR